MVQEDTIRENRSDEDDIRLPLLSTVDFGRVKSQVEATMQTKEAR